MYEFPRLVGTNYHPQDWTPGQWVRDLDSMAQAGFRMIRTNHICWDSIEPREGVFTFDWLDTVMDLAQERDIKVFLDIPGRSAPLWLHRKYPSIDIVDAAGVRLHANRRYMEDTGDPHFQEYMLRMARKLVSRYAGHPALLALGLDNEVGSGYHSYSQSALTRFQTWLEKKYGTIEQLNACWNAGRWSRRLACFFDVFFPVSAGGIKGPPERWLDMKRFFSDENLGYLQKMHDVCKRYAPDVPLSTNHWAENPAEGFDYQKGYRELIDFPGAGFYPGINPEYEDGYIGTCLMNDFRIGELEAPMWCLEFQTGTDGGYGCPEGVMRFYAYLAWVYRSDLICAWTWRTMLGGEEQYFYGLLDHDGHKSRKYHEFKKIAAEWNMLEERQIRRRPDVKRVAIAYSRDSYMVQQYNPNYYKTDYTEQVKAAYKALFHQNIDGAFIDLRRTDKAYSLVVIPGHSLMSRACADTIRAMVKAGATVIMTAYCAKVNENSTAFDEPLPGYLSDVFGIAVRGFERNVTHVSSVNEGGMEKKPEIRRRKNLDIDMNGMPLHVKIDYHEFLEPTTAEPIAHYTGADLEPGAAVTCNRYGEGLAVYTGIPANEKLLTELIRRFDTAGDFVSPAVPAGIVTRALEGDRQIYINTMESEVQIPITREAKGVLSGKSYAGELLLAPYDVDIIE